MKIFILIINILIYSTGLFSQASQMQLDCENARIDEISGLEKTLIQKIRTNYPSDRYYLTRIDSGLYNITYKSNTYLNGILKGSDLILPMIYEKTQKVIEDNNKKKYLIINQYSKAGLYDLESLTWKIPLIYETMSKLDGGNLLIQIDRYIGVCDMEGKVMLPCIFSRIEFNKHIGVYIVKDQNDKIGIYDVKTNSWILPLIYSNLSNHYGEILKLEKNDSTFIFTPDKKLKYYENIELDVSNNSVLVKENNEFKILDKNHQEIFKKRFSDIKPFSDRSYFGGFDDVIVKLKNNKYSLANLKHKILMQKSFDKVEKVNNNSFLVQNGNLFGIQKFMDGKYVDILPCIYNKIDADYQFYTAKKNNKYSLFDMNGKMIFEGYNDIRFCMYENTSFKGVGEFANLSKGANGPLAIIGSIGNYSVYDIKGFKMIPKIYEKILPLIKDRKNQWCLGFIIREKGMYGIIDLAGNTILSPEYPEIRHLNIGLMQVGKNNKYAIFDYVNRKFLTEFKYTQLMSYKENCIGLIDNEYYEISVYQNFDQEKILEQVSEKKITLDILNKNTIVKNFDSWYSSEVETTKLDQECMSRIMGQYNSQKNHYTLIKNGLYYAESSNRKGAYFDTIGMLTPFASDYDLDIMLSQKPKNNMFPIAISNRYGLFDLKLRKFKIAPKYDDFKVIEDGEYFVVSIDNHYTVINENDETVIDLGYLYSQPVYSNNSLIMKNIVGQYGILNLKIQQVKVNFEYDYIEPYANHKIAFAQKNNKYKLISYDNKLLSDILVDKVENLYIENLILIQVGKNYSILDTKEMELIPLKVSSNSFHVLSDVLKIFLKSNVKSNDINTLKSSLKKLDSYKFIKKHATYSSEKEYFNTLINYKYKLLEVGQNFHIKEVIQYENEHCEYKNEIRGFVIKQNGKFGVINRDGSVKANAVFDKIYVAKHNNILGAVKNNLYIINDKSIDTTNLKIKDFSIVYEHSLKETFYHTKGEIYLIKGKDTLGKMMLYDTDGKAILDTSYDEITHLGNECFTAKKGNKLGLLFLQFQKKLQIGIDYDNIFYVANRFYGVNDGKVIDLNFVYGKL